jgi:hypothetical protein
MPRVGFEPTIRAFDRANTVDALHRGATVINTRNHTSTHPCLHGVIINHRDSFSFTYYLYIVSILFYITQSRFWTGFTIQRYSYSFFYKTSLTLATGSIVIIVQKYKLVTSYK